MTAISIAFATTTYSHDDDFDRDLDSLDDEDYYCSISSAVDHAMARSATVTATTLPMNYEIYLLLWVIRRSRSRSCRHPSRLRCSRRCLRSEHGSRKHGTR